MAFSCPESASSLCYAAPTHSSCVPPHASSMTPPAHPAPQVFSLFHAHSFQSYGQPPTWSSFPSPCGLRLLHSEAGFPRRSSYSPLPLSFTSPRCSQEADGFLLTDRGNDVGTSLVILSVEECPLSRTFFLPPQERSDDSEGMLPLPLPARVPLVSFPKSEEDKAAHRELVQRFWPFGSQAAGDNTGWEAAPCDYAVIARPGQEEEWHVEGNAARTCQTCGECGFETCECFILDQTGGDTQQHTHSSCLSLSTSGFQGPPAAVQSTTTPSSSLQPSPPSSPGISFTPGFQSQILAVEERGEDGAEEELNSECNPLLWGAEAHTEAFGNVEHPSCLDGSMTNMRRECLQIYEERRKDVSSLLENRSDLEADFSGGEDAFSNISENDTDVPECLGCTKHSSGEYREMSSRMMLATSVCPHCKSAITSITSTPRQCREKSLRALERRTALHSNPLTSCNPTRATYSPACSRLGTISSSRNKTKASRSCGPPPSSISTHSGMPDAKKRVRGCPPACRDSDPCVLPKSRAPVKSRILSEQPGAQHVKTGLPRSPTKLEIAEVGAPGGFATAAADEYNRTVTLSCYKELKVVGAPIALQSCSVGQRQHPTDAGISLLKIWPLLSTEERERLLNDTDLSSHYGSGDGSVEECSTRSCSIEEDVADPDAQRPALYRGERRVKMERGMLTFDFERDYVQENSERSPALSGGD